VALAAHAQQVHIEVRCGLAVVGVGGQHLLVVACRCVQVVAEFAATGRHRMDVVDRDVDVVEQRFAGLLVVALVIVFWHEAIVAPVQMHFGPVDLVAALADPFEHADAGAATGQHDLRLAAFVDRVGDRVNQSVAGRGDQRRGVGVFLDDGAHMYCTFSMPCSAS
jgi:hypothetical protein